MTNPKKHETPCWKKTKEMGNPVANYAGARTCLSGKTSPPHDATNQSEELRSEFRKTNQRTRWITLNKPIRGNPREVTSTDIIFNESLKDAIDEPIIELHVSEDSQ